MKKSLIRKSFLFLCASLPLIAPLVITGCGDDPPEPPPKSKIIAGERYFPMHDGDIWYYNSANTIRMVDGDTTINGYNCKRVMEGIITTQAWSLTSERFAQHLLDRTVSFDPPLQIPLDLMEGEPHGFSSLGLVDPANNPGNIDSIRTFGEITFAGYVTRRINNVDLDSCIKIDYDYIDSVWFSDAEPIGAASQYSEFYARGIGLIDDGDLLLDQAKINGVMLPKQN